MMTLNLKANDGIKIGGLFNNEYQKTMYVNSLIENIYAGNIKFESLPKEQSDLILSELNSDINIKEYFHKPSINNWF